ncbi:hypothetical protein [Agaricicola taiwanensis]|nr:hypothetical protein [Agaricicola taiwanensis]
MTDADYRQLSAHGMAAVRDGLRWHLIESAPGHYDWSSFLPMLRSAEALGTQVVWDLCHYGWPDHLDIWSKDFPDHFGRFAAAVARLVRDETGPQAFYCPVNEISYWAWAGAEVGRINPCAVGRAGELKRQLVRSAIAAIEAIRAEDPTARFITAEPLINVVSGSPEPQHIFDAEQYRLSQFEAVDLLTGRIEPGLGGRSDYLDVVGINFYPDNQWYLGGSTIPLGHHAYRPLSEMLEEVQARYGRPILIAETGAEGSARPAWLHYIGAEVRDARARGISVEGICLYPVLDYPGWENERLCQVGLLGEAEGWEKRSVCVRTASELRRQQALFEDVAAPEPATAAE